MKRANSFLSKRCIGRSQRDANQWKEKEKEIICWLICCHHCSNEWTMIFFLHCDFFFLSCSDAEELGEVVWLCRVYTSIIVEVRMLDLRPGSAETRCPRRKRSKVNDSSFDGYKGTCLYLAAKESLFALKRSKHFLWQCCCTSMSQWVRWCWCDHFHSSLVSSHLHFL